MTTRTLVLLASLSAGLAARALADEPAPSKPELPGMAPAAAEPAKPAPEPSKPAAEPAKPAAEPAKPAPACLASAPESAGIGCAAAYRVVADAYLAAYKAMDRWIEQSSTEVSSAAERVAKLEQAVKEKEAAITALKLDRSKDAKARLRELETANRQGWKDLEAARSAEAAMCKGFARAAAQKVRELSADVTAKLTDAQKAAAQ